jgi:hypothetical protein
MAKPIWTYIYGINVPAGERSNAMMSKKWPTQPATPINTNSNSTRVSVTGTQAFEWQHYSCGEQGLKK